MKIYEVDASGPKPQVRTFEAKLRRFKVKSTDDKNGAVLERTRDIVHFEIGMECDVYPAKGSPPLKRLVISKINRKTGAIYFQDFCGSAGDELEAYVRD